MKRKGFKKKNEALLLFCLPEEQEEMLPLSSAVRAFRLLFLATRAASLALNKLSLEKAALLCFALLCFSWQPKEAALLFL